MKNIRTNTIIAGLTLVLGLFAQHQAFAFGSSQPQPQPSLMPGATATSAPVSMSANASPSPSPAPAPSASANPNDDASTYSKDEVVALLNDASDFGSDVAQTMAGAIDSVFADRGRPAAIILGNEGQGALFVGYRKGAGKLIFKGQDPKNAPMIYWRAPSIGLNVGGSASKVAILVYDAPNANAMMQKFVSLEGSFHMVVGASVSYLRDSLSTSDANAIGLAYIAVGVGWDGGIAIEDMSFTADEEWLPNL